MFMSVKDIGKPDVKYSLGQQNAVRIEEEFVSRPLSFGAYAIWFLRKVRSFY